MAKQVFPLTPARHEDSGSSRLGTAKVSLQKLKSVLGPSFGDTCDKVRYSWCFNTAFGVAAIRDYCGSYTFKEFSIAATNAQAAEALCAALRQHGINAQVDEMYVAARKGC